MDRYWYGKIFPELTFNYVRGCTDMKKSYAKKIQALLINHLLNQGEISLLLPDGVTIEIGITQEGKHGTEISNDYCYVKSSRDGKSTMLDTYNLSLQYTDKDKMIVCFDNSIDEEGRTVRSLEVV